MTPEQRASNENGIWLCQSCAKLIDNDPTRFTAGILRRWKTEAEAHALAEVYGTVPAVDYRSDWARLADLARASFAHVRDSIGGLVHLQREREAEQLRDALHRSVGVVVLGPSGVGKSAVAKREAAQHLADGRRCLWFNARSFERRDFAEFQAALQLSHALSGVLSSPPASLDDSLLFLDGLDRLYDDGAFALVGTLVSALGLGQKGCPWRVIITCQTEEWPRIQPKLLRAGVPVANWQMMEVEPVTIDGLAPVWKSIPQSDQLKSQPHLHALLLNLKILDVIASRLVTGGEVQTTGWVGESSVASWYWETDIAVGTDALARTRFVMLLGEKQAEFLRPGVPLTSFDVADTVPLDGLVRDRVCQRTDEEQILFGHDLLGDWARLRVLLGHSHDLPQFLKGRLSLPLWHRAVRLYGVRLLEHAKDVGKWRALCSSLADVAGPAAADLLLEAIIFATNPLPLLETVRADLIANDGELLRRLLGRFLFFATLPEPTAMAIARAQGMDVIRAG